MFRTFTCPSSGLLIYKVVSLPDVVLCPRCCGCGPTELVCSLVHCLSLTNSAHDYTRAHHFSSRLPPSGGTYKYAKAPSTKKTLRDSLPIDMILSALYVLVVAQSSLEVPEGLMNNPVYDARSHLYQTLTLNFKLSLCSECCMLSSG